MLYHLTNIRYTMNREKYGEHDPIKIANAIFINKDFTIKKDFAQNFMDYYRGNSIGVDFKSVDAIKAIKVLLICSEREIDKCITKIARYKLHHFGLLEVVVCI